jgi:FlaA1/EpsC-like NDP-sugar epimerase
LLKTFNQKLIALPRIQKQLILLAMDALALPLCFVLAVELRLGASPITGHYAQWDWLQCLLMYAVGVTLLSIPMLRLSGLYRSVLGYLDIKTLVKGGLSVLIAAIAVYLFSHITLGVGVGVGAQGGGGAAFPRSAILIFWFVAFSYLMCSRYAALMLLHHQRRLHADSKRVAVWGAGSAGAQTVAALRNSAEYQPVCFFDEDKDKVGSMVGGLHVNPVHKLAYWIERLGVEQVILAMPSASIAQRHAVLMALAALPPALHVITRTLPGLADLVGGKVEVSRLRNIEVADLLGRDAIAPDAALFAKCITGKTVLVSGARGLIGSKICRQILSQSPAVLIALELNEFALYSLEQELQPVAASRGTQLVLQLGNASDAALLHHVFASQRIDTVYHAAAYKHVPLVEANPCMGLANNVSSTWALAAAAAAHGVGHFILISTDKAVRPTNVMGASKRVAELIVQAHASNNNKNNNNNNNTTTTTFCMVRFGNVLGSSGSVIPKFMAQIEAGGPVTVTDPDIIRYFMLIPEAAQLVIQAGAMAQGGEVFVLDMGEPVKITHLAQQAIKLSGHTLRDEQNPDGDIAIVFTGLRPGEKLYEELLIGSNSQPSQHPRILQAQEHHLPLPALSAQVQQLLTQCTAFDTPQVLQQLKSLVPEFDHQLNAK